MRPDRIILGEVRGEEALDMLQAMNTGHDGGLTTIHANSSRDALHRLDTMVAMANLNLPERAIRQQIASAIHLLVHVTRLSDGRRRVTGITEITGMEGEVLTHAGHLRVRAHRRDAKTARCAGVSARPASGPSAPIASQHRAGSCRRRCSSTSRTSHDRARSTTMLIVVVDVRRDRRRRFSPPTGCWSSCPRAASSGAQAALERRGDRRRAAGAVAAQGAEQLSGIRR